MTMHTTTTPTTQGGINIEKRNFITGGGSHLISVSSPPWSASPPPPSTNFQSSKLQQPQISIVSSVLVGAGFTCSSPKQSTAGTGGGGGAGLFMGKPYATAATATATATTPNHFTLFSDYDLSNCKTAENGGKIQLEMASPGQAAASIGHLELGFGQQLIWGANPYAEQCYGVYSTHGTQFGGRTMLPLSMTTDGGPIFVNAKQYNAIMRRRKKRTELEMENKMYKLRKPYLHLSRHLHAMRRERGSGGRFLNKKNPDSSVGKTGETEKQLPQTTGSQTSEVLQSDLGINLKVSNDRRSTSPGSEVTSHMFARAKTLYPTFQMNQLHQAAYEAFPSMANTGLGIAMGAHNYL